MKYEEELVTNTYGRQYWIYKNDTFYQQRIANAGPYQKQNLVALRRLLESANTILDCGMNIGMNTIEYATFSKNVIGFEPTPQTFDMAEKNVKLNQNQSSIKNWYEKYDINANMKVSGKIELYNLGLGESQGEFELSVKINNAGQNHILKENSKATNTVKVKIITLDSLNLENIDAIKVDTEGYEFAVMKGAEKTIDKNRPIIQLEIDPKHCKRFEYTPQQLTDWLYQKDYKSYLCDGTIAGPIWEPVKNKIERFFVPDEKDVSHFEKKLTKIFF